MLPLNPRESGVHIVNNAKYVRVLPTGIDKLAHEVIASILDKRISVLNFTLHELHPKPTDAYATEWVFLIDTLNFCFWTPINYTKYKVNGYTGYFALCSAINRALSEGVDLTNAKFYAQINEKTLSHIFRSDDGETVIPLLKKRLECLHEVGNRLLEKWNGKFENVLKAANYSAVRLLNLIVEEFPCFRDEAHYAGKRVSFYKRAQILIGDLWSCFHGKGLGYFSDIDHITMFADYRVPQVLVHFGSLEYSPELLEFLGKDEILQNGDPREVEIRGASIYIVEQVVEQALRILEQEYPRISRPIVNSILIDQFLWDFRRKYANELDHIPFHKVLSIYY